jgi:parallel beta-helix repeat protein
MVQLAKPKKALLLFVLLSLIVSALASSGAIGSITTYAPNSITKLTSSSVIHVDNDAQLASLISSNGWSGTGTISNPYIIENLLINASGGPNAVFIGNTSAYIIVRYCSLSGAVYSSLPFRAGCGIALYHARNATVENNYCSWNKNGIWLYSSSGIILSNNDCTGNEYGIGTYSWSNGNTISNNNCSGNKYGIYAHQSNYSNISWNICNSDYYGICPYWSDHCIVSNNTCNGINNKNGIDLFQSNYNIISDNNCSDTLHGIYLANSDYNIVQNDYCFGYQACGIMLKASGNNLIDKLNSCYTGNNGIHLETASDNNTVSNCTFIGNKNSGVYIGIDCQYNWITDCNLSSNKINGVSTSFANNNTISNNTIYKNSWEGGYLESSMNNVLFGNLFIGNNQASSVYNPSHVQARDNGVNLWNTSYGNLWSDWLSPDANADGIVDVAYTIKGGNNMDNLPVTLTITNATPNGTGVKIDAKIVVVFSEAMDRSTVKIMVSNNVEGKITLGDKVATYTPDKLEYNMDYRVTVSGMDLAGNSVTKNWTFSTIRTLGEITGTIGNATGGPISGANVTLSNGAWTLPTSLGTLGSRAWRPVHTI